MMVAGPPTAYLGNALPNIVVVCSAVLMSLVTTVVVTVMVTVMV